MFVDTHTHFCDEWLLPDADEAIQRALEAGVGKMIQADVDSRDRSAMWEIGRRYPGVLYQMLGLYPGSVGPHWREELDLVFSLAQNGAANRNSGNAGNNGSNSSNDSKTSNAGSNDSNTDGKRNDSKAKADAPVAGDEGEKGIVAIGEIGLDYHQGVEFIREQQEVLRLQLELASALNLPVNIHLRDAWEDFFAILSDCTQLQLRGNLHCFTASYEIYERANRYGNFSVGIGGVVTFKNAAVAKAVEKIPLEKIVLETDAPYLAPTPYRGKRNESAYLPLIAQKVADIKGLPLRAIETMTTHNAQTLFGI